MGRDWKYWGGSGGGGSKKPRSHIQTTHAAAGTGCINAVFQLFDFHHFHSTSNNLWQTVPSFKHLPEEPEHASTILKGAEAPRNSLEMDPPPPPPIESLSNSSVIKNPEPSLNVNPMRLRIQTRVPNIRTEDLSSESSSSPSAKTPNLVARLMGLDLLPQTSPRSSSSSSINTATNSSLKSRHYHLNSAPKDSKIPSHVRAKHGKFVLDTDFLGSRSLPETPRISSERRSTDVDFHRLSLQSNRENSSGAMEELMELSRKSTGRRDLRVLEEEENRSPGFYARQIVKQVKDNITRKVGSDITNTVRNNNRQSDQSVLLKSKKPESRSTTTGDDPVFSNCSPRLRFLELKNKGPNSQLSQSWSQTSETVSDVGTTLKEEKKQSSDQLKCREMGKEIRRDQRLCLGSQLNRSKSSSDPIPIKNKKEVTFFRSKLGRKKEKSPSKKKCKKTPLSSELLSNSTNLFHVKKDPPSPLTKLPKKQEEYEYDNNDDEAGSSERSVQAKTLTFRRDGNGPAGLVLNSGKVGNGSLDLHDYVKMITAGGIDGSAADPAAFQRLEEEVSRLKLLDEGSRSVAINMDLRCNRLLIFDLVKELVGMEQSRKEMVSGTICKKIMKLEAADCRVLEDIDGIIERDLRGEGRIVELDEEILERIVEEIQQELVDKLIMEETTSLFC